MDTVERCEIVEWMLWREMEEMSGVDAVKRCGRDEWSGCCVMWMR